MVTHRTNRQIAFLFIVLLAPTAIAQTSVKLDVADGPAYVNEPFYADVQVSNFKSCESPDFPAIDGCSVKSLGQSSDSTNMSIVNNQISQSRTRTYRFEIRPTRAGELVIPPIAVNVDGKILKTKSTRVAVQAADDDDLVLVEISCDRKRIFVGQTVPVTMTIWVKPALAFGQRIGGRDMWSFFERDGWGVFQPPQRFSEIQRANPDGSKSLYYSFETSAEFTPTRPGAMAFDDVEIGMSYPTRFTQSVFGDLRATSVRRLRIRPTVKAVAVVPLPSEGRPENFSGAVGAYEIDASARPTSVRVGDPIELTVDISVAARGDGPLDSLPPPPLASDTRLTESFRVPRENLAGSVSGGRKRFTQTIRPLRAELREIPSIEYPYFDPESERYVVARSEPIPIDVSAAEKLDASTLTGIEGPKSEQPAENLLPLDGLRGNALGEAELLAVTRAISSREVLVATLAPPAVFTLTWLGLALVRARGGDAARRRRQSAQRTAQRRIEQARGLQPRELAGAVHAALSGYVADRLNEPAARVAGRDGVEWLRQRGAAPATINRLGALVDRCEQISFGASVDGEAAALLRDASVCIDMLERERL